MTAARLLVVDGDVLFGSALQLVLAAEGHQVARVTRATDLRQDVLRAQDLVVVSDALVSAVTERLPRPGTSPRVLVLSPTGMHDQLVAALEAGAQGFLGKDTDVEGVLGAVSAVLRGEAVVPPTMLGGLLHELVQQRRRPAVPHGLVPLSRREKEVLELLARGHAQEAIAKALVISPQTARTHIQKVIGKLGAHSRVEAVAVALRHGLVAAS